MHVRKFVKRFVQLIFFPTLLFKHLETATSLNFHSLAHEVFYDVLKMGVDRDVMR